MPARKPKPATPPIRPRPTDATPCLRCWYQRRTSTHPNAGHQLKLLGLELPGLKLSGLKYGAAVPQAPAAWRRRSVRDVQLAFLGPALARLARILDPILVIVAVGRQQPDNLVTSARAGAADRARRIENRLTDPVFVRPQSGTQRRHLSDGHGRHFYGGNPYGA